MQPFPRDLSERRRIMGEYIKAAKRRGISDPDTMSRNIGQHLAAALADLRDALKRRHPELHLRSLGWDEPRRSQVAAEWDEYDRQHQLNERKRYRKDAREAIAAIRWCRWIHAQLTDAAVRAWIEDDPIAYLDWRYRHGRYDKHSLPLLVRGKELVAEVQHRSCFRAVVYKFPFPSYYAPSPFYTTRGETPAPDPLDNALEWQNFRQRKQAVAWIVETVQRRSIAIFGADYVDIPEVRLT